MREDSSLQQFLQASKTGNLSEVRKWIEDEELTVDASNSFGLTALHRACQGGHIDIVRYLIGRGASVNARCHGQRTALHEAWQVSQNLELVRYLVEDCYADVAVRDECGQTILHHLYDNDIADYALSFLSISFCGRQGNQTNGTRACGANQYNPFVRLNINVQDNRGRNPLHEVIDRLREHRPWRLVHRMVKECGAAINATDNRGFTPLHLVCKSLRWTMDLDENPIRILIDEYDADPDMFVYEGITSLEWVLGFLRQHRQRNLYSSYHNRQEWDNFFLRLQDTIRFLFFKQESLPRTVLHKVWNFHGRTVYVRDVNNGFVSVQVDHWPIRMFWMDHHCRTTFGIQSAETSAYPVHSLVRCSPSFMPPDEYDEIDWREALHHFGKRRCQSKNKYGLVPLQVYLIQEQDAFRASQQNDRIPSYAVMLKYDLLEPLLKMDDRPSSLLLHEKQRGNGTTWGTVTVIDPFATPVATRVSCFSRKEEIRADRVLTDLLYRLVRLQPEVLGRLIVSDQVIRGCQGEVSKCP